MVENERDIIVGYLYEIKEGVFEDEKRSLEEIERVVVAMKFMADGEVITMRLKK